MAAIKALTVDVGTGTQDILLYESNKNIRNCLKMILPSPTLIVAEKIKEMTERQKNILLTGYTMGGGPSTFAIRKHLERGLKVTSLPEPALTINDDIRKVEEMGVEISNNPEREGLVEVELRDVFMREFHSFFGSIGIEVPDKVFLAVQDHGFSPDMSNRRFRFRVFEKTLRGGNLYSFFYHEDEVPEHFNRMKSALKSIKDFSDEKGLKIESYVIDTVFAALIGAMTDLKRFPAFIVNFGNSHTIGAVVDEDGSVFSLFEHHTSIMRRKGSEGVKKFLESFIHGKIDNEQVFGEGGHGAFVKEVVEVRDFVATGPNAELSPYRTANPAGDTMITGNVGMIHAYLQRNG
jgi:uncharacterized protein (DUF1786 family)